MEDVHTTLRDPALLRDWLQDARQRTLELISDLDDQQLMGPRLEIVNPLLWEIGHVAWFQEKWVLRHLYKRRPIRSDADALYDSIAIPHDVRWDLPLPSRRETLAYMAAVQEEILSLLSGTEELPEQLAYFVLYGIYHEDMHTEAFTYGRQTLQYPTPPITRPQASHPAGEGTPSHSDEVTIEGGRFFLGATGREPFVFDNEKWAHPVEIKPFRIDRYAVTQGQFLEFVEAGGYHNPDFWTEEGWGWRRQAEAEHPVYWKKEANGRWLRRHFDRWIPLEAEHPVIHVNWYEASAYCRWAGRRLPSEAEWELAACLQPGTDPASSSEAKALYPWGNQPPAAGQLNTDWLWLNTIPVTALARGDSRTGLRQLLGNVWEWTDSVFGPYPGFTPDPYKEYSEPWFYTRRVLRGGSWATRSRMLRNSLRNYFTPERRDVFAGFRTCALDQ